MPEGPLGFPRVTDIGPFVEADAEQEFNRSIESGLEFTHGLDREVLAIHSIQTDDVDVVRAELSVIVDPQPEEDGILGSIKESVNKAVAGKEVAYMRYWMHKPSGVAAIKGVEVEKDVRRHGIATSLKEKELDFMRRKGIDLVYTDVISEGGYRLAKKTGFKPIGEARHLTGTEATLYFSHDHQRGAMFRTL